MRILGHAIFYAIRLSRDGDDALSACSHIYLSYLFLHAPRPARAVSVVFTWASRWLGEVAKLRIYSSYVPKFLVLSLATSVSK